MPYHDPDSQRPPPWWVGLYPLLLIAAIAYAAWRLKP